MFKLNTTIQAEAHRIWRCPHSLELVRKSTFRAARSRAAMSPSQMLKSKLGLLVSRLSLDVDLLDLGDRNKVMLMVLRLPGNAN
jgi:hypothetical protein